MYKLWTFIGFVGEAVNDFKKGKFLKIMKSICEILRLFVGDRHLIVEHLVVK